MKKILLSIISAFILLSGVFKLHSQSTSIDLQVGFVFSQPSVDLTFGSLGVFVVDISGEGFAGLSSSSDFLGETPVVGSSFGNSNTIVMSISEAIDFGGSSGFTFGLQSFDFGAIGASTGSQLGFYFFESYDSTSQPISLGVDYGFFRSDVISTENGSDIAWLVPPPATNNNLFAFGDSFNPLSSISDAELTAGFTVVPEPSTYAAIVGLMALALVGYRRFRK